MWGIQLNPNQLTLQNLPLITTQSFIILCVTLLLLRISTQLILQKYFNIKNERKQHNSKSLQFSYFYHLSIIILGFSQLNWNLFDLCVWIFSYVCIGMGRKMIFIINIERQILINGYGYNNQIVKLIGNSIKLGLIFGVFSIGYILGVNYVFFGVMRKVISMLCFPSLMLFVDSVYLFLVSKKTQKHMIYFYNQNINGISPVYKIDLTYKITSYSIKCFHFFNLILICSAIIIRKIDILDYMWIFSVLMAFYQSITSVFRYIGQYRYMKKFITSIDRILERVKKVNDQVCIICMEPLLNSYRLIQCGHLFHYKCLFQWMQAKEQCPICRVRINLNM